MGEEPKQGDKEEEAGGKKSESAFTKKIIKLLTVAAYMSGVSGAGVLLSLYYIFFWDPQITGVRPPGYLKSGDKIGLPQTSARIAPSPLPLPQAFSGRQPIAYPHKMSREFMEAYMKNYTEDSADRVLGMLEGDPTPKVLPVAGEDPPATPTHTPPAPAHYNLPPLQSDSLSSSLPQRHHSAATLQHRQEHHPQRPRHGQGDPPFTPAA